VIGVLALPTARVQTVETTTTIGIKPVPMKNETDAGTTAEVYLTWAEEPGCSATNGCWIAHATSSGACTSADVVANFTRTPAGTGGPSTTFSITDLLLVSTLSITAPAAQYRYVHLSATCTRQARGLAAVRPSDTGS
jgi:hypothetical protein